MKVIIIGGDLHPLQVSEIAHKFKKAGLEAEVGFIKAENIQTGGNVTKEAVESATHVWECGVDSELEMLNGLWKSFYNKNSPSRKAHKWDVDLKFNEAFDEMKASPIINLIEKVLEDREVQDDGFRTKTDLQDSLAIYKSAKELMVMTAGALGDFLSGDLEGGFEFEDELTPDNSERISEKDWQSGLEDNSEKENIVDGNSEDIVEEKLIISTEQVVEEPVKNEEA